jgi:hypothetical protein
MKRIPDHEAKGTNEEAQREGPQAHLAEASHKEESPAAAPDDRPCKPAPDPFDPAHLALGQDFAEALGVKKLTTHVPVRKPYQHEWF